jgi:glutamate formiminotransferase/formiminotetrahydrofolate cyclodeaminase
LKKLIDLNITEFTQLTASESVTPGGGSILACVGALGVSLGMMNATISAHKKGWESKRKKFEEIAKKGKILQEKLIQLIDEDSGAYSAVIESYRLPKNTDDEKRNRIEEIQNTMKSAIETQRDVMQTAFDAMNLVKEITEIGNPNCASDSAVGGLILRTAVKGAGLNIRTNIKVINDTSYKTKMISVVDNFEQEAEKLENEIMRIVLEKI